MAIERTINMAKTGAMDVRPGNRPNVDHAAENAAQVARDIAHRAKYGGNPVAERLDFVLWKNQPWASDESGKLAVVIDANHMNASLFVFGDSSLNKPLYQTACQPAWLVRENKMSQNQSTAGCFDHFMRMADLKRMIDAPEHVDDGKEAIELLTSGAESMQKKIDELEARVTAMAAKVKAAS